MLYATPVIISELDLEKKKKRKKEEERKGKKEVFFVLKNLVSSHFRFLPS